MKIYIKNARLSTALLVKKAIEVKFNTKADIEAGYLYCFINENKVSELIITCESIDKNVKVFKMIQINDKI